MKYDFFVNTTPSRLKESHCLRSCVHSLLRQTITPESVYVCIPYEYKRMETKVDDEEIPNWIFNDSDKIRVLRSNDYGAATRYVYASTVNDVKNSHNYACSADDDVIYKREAFETLFKFKEQQSLDAASHWSYMWWNRLDENGDGQDVDLSLKYMQGVDMILTSPSNLLGFKDFLVDCYSDYPDCILNDDLTLSYWLQYNGKKIGSVNVGSSESMYTEQSTASDETRLTDQLGKGARYFKTFEIISYLKKNYPIKKLNMRA